MRAYPWEATPVGPVSSWPQSLKHAVRTVLDLHMPAYLAWGDGYIQFFNDAYMPILGGKLEGALGNDTRVTWPEAWPTIQPLWEQVRQGATFGHDEFLMTLHRNGYPESCYFTHSYSPVYGGDGSIGGVLATLVETTRAVLGERRQTYQLKLADTLRRETEFAPMLKATIRLTSEYFTGSNVAYVELDEGKRTFTVKEEWKDGVETGGAQGTLPIDMLSPSQLDALRGGATICINDVSTDPECAAVAKPCLMLGIHSVVVIPLKDAATACTAPASCTRTTPTAGPSMSAVWPKTWRAAPGKRCAASAPRKRCAKKRACSSCSTALARCWLPRSTSTPCCSPSPTPPPN